MNRNDVEKWLDLQVMAGRMSPELKEEKLREYDLKTQQIQAQQGGQSINSQYNQYNNQFGGQYEQHDVRYNASPFEKPKAQSNYLSTPEMIIVLILAIAITVAALKDSGTLMLFLAGILFTYIGIRVIARDVKDKRSVSYVPVIAGICGIGMIALAGFQLMGTEEMKKTYESYTGTIACVSVIVVGIGIIIGNLISRSSAQKKYTQPVTAKCVQLLTPRNGSGVPVKLTPLYEFYYNGETRRIMNSFYSNRGNPRVGEEREIFINHELDGYYDPKRSKVNSIFLIILSLFFIFMGTLCLILAM